MKDSFWGGFCGVHEYSVVSGFETLLKTKHENCSAAVRVKPHWRDLAVGVGGGIRLHGGRWESPAYPFSREPLAVPTIHSCPTPVLSGADISR